MHSSGDHSFEAILLEAVEEGVPVTDVFEQIAPHLEKRLGATHTDAMNLLDFVTATEVSTREKFENGTEASMSPLMVESLINTLQWSSEDLQRYLEEVKSRAMLLGRDHMLHAAQNGRDPFLAFEEKDENKYQPHRLGYN